MVSRRSPWPNARSPMFKEDLSKKLDIEPENIELRVRKSAEGETAEVKVRIKGLTEKEAADVERRAKRAAKECGLPTPEGSSRKVVVGRERYPGRSPPISLCPRLEHQHQQQQQQQEQEPHSGFVSGVRSAVTPMQRSERRVRSADNARDQVLGNTPTTLSGKGGRSAGAGASSKDELDAAGRARKELVDAGAMGRIRDMVKGALDRDYAISKRRQNLVRAFRVLDGNSSNNLSRAELDRGLTRIGLWLPLESRQQLFTALDRDRDGLVNIEDFKRFLFTDEKSAKQKGGLAGYTSNAALLEDDTTALKRSMKRRRVIGVMGKELQRRFRDYDLGDSLLYALHGVMPDDYSGDVSLQRSEFEAILLKAQVPITAAELRWVMRTFTVPDEDGRGFRLERLEAAPLINFALGVSDPWAETGSLEEILASITPEEMKRLENKQQRRTGTMGPYAAPRSHTQHDHPRGGNSGGLVDDYGHSDDGDVDGHAYDLNEGEWERRRRPQRRRQRKSGRDSAGDGSRFGKSGGHYRSAAKRSDGNDYDEVEYEDVEDSLARHETYCGTKVASLRRRPKSASKMRTHNLPSNNRQSSRESLDNEYGSPRTTGRRRRDGSDRMLSSCGKNGFQRRHHRRAAMKHRDAEKNPLLRFTRPVFGMRRQRKKTDVDWRNFKNEGGYTANSDEGIDVRYEHYNTAAGGGRRRSRTVRGSRSNNDDDKYDDDGDDGYGDYHYDYGYGGFEDCGDEENYDSDCYDDESYNDNANHQHRQPPYRRTPTSTSRWRDGVGEYHEGVEFADDDYDDAGSDNFEPMATHGGVRRQRQRRPRSIATEGIAAGVGWGSGSQDYHEVRTTVEFLGGEDDKAAKYLARKIVRERVLKHRKLGENEMGSPGRPNPVVERVIDGGLVHTNEDEMRLNSAPQLIERTTEEQAGADASEAATERGLAGIAGTIAHRRVASAEGGGGGRRVLVLKPEGAVEGVTATPFPEDADESVVKNQLDSATYKPKSHLLKCLVTCPPSLYPGDAFDIAVEQDSYTVVVPKGVNPGQQFTVRVDVSREPGSAGNVGRPDAAQHLRSGDSSLAGRQGGLGEKGPRGAGNFDVDDQYPRGERLRDVVQTGIKVSKANTGVRGFWRVDRIESPFDNVEEIEDNDARAATEFAKAEAQRAERRRRIATEATAEGGQGLTVQNPYRSNAHTSGANSGRRHVPTNRRPVVGKSAGGGGRYDQGRYCGGVEGGFGSADRKRGTGGLGIATTQENGLPFSHAPFAAFPGGRATHGSISSMTSYGERGGGDGGGSPASSANGRVPLGESIAVVERNDGGGPPRSRLGTVSWEWEWELLQGAKKGMADRGEFGGYGDGKDNDPVPGYGVRAAFASSPMRRSRAPYGNGGNSPGGGRRRIRISRHHHDSGDGPMQAADYITASWDDGMGRGQIGGQEGEKELSSLVAARAANRAPMNPVDPKEYTQMGLHYERDPLNHGDDRPLRGNHKTACGRYPLLPGKWRSRVGASKFAEQPKVRHLAQQIKQLYLHMYASYESGPNERPAVNVRAFFDAADRDQDGLIGLEDMILLSMEENASRGSRANGLGLENSAADLPPELATVDQFIQSVKTTAGRSLGSTVGTLSFGEIERWLEPPDPTLQAIRTKVATHLERQLARDLGSGAVSGGWAGGGEAAANMLRAAMRRVTVEVQEDTYDGAVPIKLVSQHALIKAVRRAELPLSIAEIGVLAEAFKSKWPDTGGTTMRDVDYDAVVHFLTK